MLTRLRRDFVAITMVLVGLVLVAGVVSSLIASYLNAHTATRQALIEALSDTDATVSSQTKRMLTTGSLALRVDVDEAGAILEQREQNFEVNNQTLTQIVDEIVASHKNQGTSQYGPIEWMRAPRTGGGWRIAMIDTTDRDASLRAHSMIEAAVLVVSGVALLILSRGLAARVVAPVELAWDAQRKFLSDASHELKTPLAVILANTQILISDPEVPASAQRWVESTRDEAQHMHCLVENLLTLARADEESVRRMMGQPEEVVHMPLDMTSLVEREVLEFDAVAFERGCTIVRHIQEGVWVEGDEAELARLIATLVDNATKYANPRSNVVVSLRKNGNQTVFSVTDHGIPIAAEDLKHLFDRFYRSDRARERSSNGGFGLGLSIAKAIVDKHNGTITATSNKTGTTKFTVTL